MKNQILIVILLILASTNSLASNEENKNDVTYQADRYTAIWRISKYEKRAETVIADLAETGRYEICRASHDMNQDAHGLLHITIDGLAHLDTDLDINACLIIEGKKIGLVANEFPKNAVHFRGTYRRLGETSGGSNISSPINWSYYLAKNSSDEIKASLIASASMNTYRVCQKLTVIDGNPSPPYEVGYWLYKDGRPVSSDSGGRRIVRFTQGNCIDISGMTIYASILADEVNKNIYFNPGGSIQYFPFGSAPQKSKSKESENLKRMENVEEIFEE